MIEGLDASFKGLPRPLKDKVHANSDEPIQDLCGQPKRTVQKDVTNVDSNRKDYNVKETETVWTSGVRMAAPTVTRKLRHASAIGRDLPLTLHRWWMQKLNAETLCTAPRFVEDTAKPTIVKLAFVYAGLSLLSTKFRIKLLLLQYCINE
ncbi:hypothetical protein V6N12_027355 [Hibiscus sabdariffa]|uniref:Uncharacterized protein n=1 Tax=Hibiscus sabdariffa TaxID=183260 RepID=A0ABR2DUG8_9ROSI